MAWLDTVLSSMVVANIHFRHSELMWMGTQGTRSPRFLREAGNPGFEYQKFLINKLGVNQIFLRPCSGQAEYLLGCWEPQI